MYGISRILEGKHFNFIIGSIIQIKKKYFLVIKFF